MVSAALIATLLAVPVQGLSYDQLMATVSERPRGETAQAIEDWIASAPGDPRVSFAWGQAAALWANAGDGVRERRALEKAAAFPDDEGRSARRRLATLDINAHRFDEAIALLDGLMQAAPPEDVEDLLQAHEHAVTLRSRFRLAHVLGFLLVLEVVAFLGFAGWRKGRAAFWPLPREVIWFVPVMGLLALSALRFMLGRRFAILTVCAGGLVLVVSTSILARAVTPRLSVRLVLSLLAAASAAALLYFAIVSSQMSDMMLGGDSD